MLKVLAGTCALLLLFVGGGVLVVKLRRNSYPEKWRIITTSPNNVYLVRLEGETVSPSQPYYGHGNHKVSFSVLKQGLAIVTDEPLYQGDEYDDLFLNLYPIHEWVSDSTLRFGEKDILTRSQHDKIIVSNNSDQSIKYLGVNFGVSELFIIVELPPGKTIQLYTQPQTDKQSDFSGITCFTKIDDRYVEKSAGFNIRGQYKGAATYYIDVEGPKINIRSQEFEPTKR